ncbi:MAG TPA: type II secretion system F family protein [Chloroflexota bacterium]|nr:type II secretion system F family protein [Chloroflexota bacterium]
MSGLLELPVALGTGAGLAVLLLVIGLHRLITGRLDLNRRLRGYADGPVPVREVEEASRRPQPRAGARRGFTAALARDLARADLKLTVSEFLMVQGLLCAAGLGVGLAAGNLALAVGAAALGLFAPRFYVGRRQRARLKAFNGQLGDTLMLMANALRSGYSLLQAMDTVARNAPPPTSVEFARVIREVGLGLTPEQALQNLVRRIASEDLELMVTAINIQHEVGGNLAQILDTISETIRERVRIKGEISSLTAQQRLSGYIIAALPMVVAAGLFLINPSYLMPLFSFRTVFSIPLIALPTCAFILVVLGFFSIRRIVAIEV